ncbi:MAG: flagellar filament capping protein FliD [Fervidobacterium sp.]
MESSGNIGAYSQFKTLADLGITEDKSLNINEKSINLKSTDTLANVVSKINNALADLNAFYEDKIGRLVITSKTTGDNLINVSGDADLLNAIGLSNGTFSVGQIAKANITINGYTELIESKSNTLNYNGLILELSSTGTSTVTVSVNKEKIVEKVQEFVDEWNELTDFLYKKLTENKVTVKKDIIVE